MTAREIQRNPPRSRTVSSLDARSNRPLPGRGHYSGYPSPRSSRVLVLCRRKIPDGRYHMGGERQLWSNLLFRIEGGKVGNRRTSPVGDRPGDGLLTEQ